MKSPVGPNKASNIGNPINAQFVNISPNSDSFCSSRFFFKGRANRNESRAKRK